MDERRLEVPGSRAGDESNNDNESNGGKVGVPFWGS